MNTIGKNTAPVPQKALRLWPAIVIVILQWLIRFGLPWVIPSDMAIQVGIFGGLIGGFVLIIWWAFFSRARWFERLGAIGLMILALICTQQFIDVSIRTANMGMMFTIFSIPVLSLAFVVWAVATRNLSSGIRRVTMVAAILLATGFWVLLRTDGMDGSAHQDLVWRWSKTSEKRLLDQANHKMMPISLDSAAMAAEAEWPGFGDLTGMVLSRASRSRLIGLNHPRLRCGGGQWDPVAPPSQSMALYSSPRNSAVNTRWLPATI